LKSAPTASSVSIPTSSKTSLSLRSMFSANVLLQKGQALNDLNRFCKTRRFQPLQNITFLAIHFLCQHTPA
jgi:hypothetical protein